MNFSMKIFVLASLVCGASAFAPVRVGTSHVTQSCSATTGVQPLFMAGAEDVPVDAKVAKKDEAKEKSPPPPPDEVDVSKLDIRVGVITKAYEHAEADKLFCEEIDIGEEEPRQFASGLKAYYDVEDLVGQRVLVLANLKTRKMVGFPSHGMVLCAAVDDQVKFIEPPADAEIGERVMVEGFDGEPASENQIIKKKMLPALFPELYTNDEGVATYSGTPMTTSAGPCVSPLKNAEIS